MYILDDSFFRGVFGKYFPPVRVLLKPGFVSLCFVLFCLLLSIILVPLLRGLPFLHCTLVRNQSGTSVWVCFWDFFPVLLIVGMTVAKGGASQMELKVGSFWYKSSEICAEFISQYTFFMNFNTSHVHGFQKSFCPQAYLLTLFSMNFLKYPQVKCPESGVMILSASSSSKLVQLFWDTWLFKHMLE